MNEITIKVPLAEYLYLKTRSGLLYWTIDEETRLEIINQEEWEQICYITPMPNKLEGEKRLFQCWRLEDWKINSRGKNLERIKTEVKEILEENREKEKHNLYARNAQKMLDFLVNKGMNHFDAKKQVEYAKNPRVETKEELDMETLEFVKVTKTNERDLKLQKAFGLCYEDIEIS